MDRLGSDRGALAPVRRERRHSLNARTKQSRDSGNAKNHPHATQPQPQPQPDKPVSSARARLLRGDTCVLPPASCPLEWCIDSHRITSHRVPTLRRLRGLRREGCHTRRSGERAPRGASVRASLVCASRSICNNYSYLVASYRVSRIAMKKLMQMQIQMEAENGEQKRRENES